MALTAPAANDIALGKGGTYSMSRDAIKHNVWDTRYFTDATMNDWTYYSVPIGGAWQVGAKTLSETNLTDSGKLPNGQTFLAKRFGVSLISPIAADEAALETVVQAYYTWIQHAVYEIRIAGREFDFQVHGRQFLPPVAAVGVGTAESIRVGDEIASGWISLDNTPIFIDQLVSFSVAERVNAADVTNVVPIIQAAATLLNANKCYIQVCLEGFLTRAK